jgi:hypothetical protein
MGYVRVVLSGVAAILVALLGPGLLIAMRSISQQGATGIAFSARGFREAMFSPVFWILAVLFFAAFYAAARLNSKALRVLLFWTPTVAACVVGLATLLLFAYVSVVAKRG